jgi:hypothetical protein
MQSKYVSLDPVVANYGLQRRCDRS